MMKRIVVACSLALGVAVPSFVQAETATFTVVADGAPFDMGGVVVGGLQSEGRLQPSELFLGALAVMGADLASAAPDTRVELLEDALSVVVSPVQHVKGDVDFSTGGFVAQQVVLSGGFSIVKPWPIPSGKRSSTEVPGSITLSDITVDLDTKGIYANVRGDNGVGSMLGLRIWDYQTLTGSTGIVMTPCRLDGFCPGATMAGFEVSGLAITQPAFDVMAQSLGLTAFGKLSMAGITDYGTLTISPVPESSTLVLMSLGLLGLLGLAIRTSVQRRSR